MYRVYRYVFPDGMIYVGMTKNSIQTRRDQGYQHNKRLQTAIRSVGWAGLTVEILADNLTREQAEEKEKYFISVFRSDNPENGYNVSSGGKSTFAGLKHSESYKKHMSDLYKGRSFSQETLNKMKESHKPERKEVIQYALSGEELKVFESLHDAADKVKGYAANISRACKSGKPYKQSLWAYKKGGDDR